MTGNFYTNQQFIAESTVLEGEYELCTFTDCDLTRANLSGSIFYECRFETCRLAGVRLADTALRDVVFVNCDLSGLLFESCSDFLFSVTFTQCQLRKASFRSVRMKGTCFTKSDLQAVDFTGTDLTDAVFDLSDLDHAIFNQTTLDKADFRTARNYALDPEQNRLKKARFSWPGVVGLLVKYGIDFE